MTDKPVHETIGDRFAELLGQELSHANFVEMQRRNRVEQDDGVCHSHDFLDANMTMALAFADCEVADLEHEDFADNQEIVDLWNAAWDYAKAKYLR